MFNRWVKIFWGTPKKEHDTYGKGIESMQTKCLFKRVYNDPLVGCQVKSFSRISTTRDQPEVKHVCSSCSHVQELVFPSFPSFLIIVKQTKGKPQSSLLKHSKNWSWPTISYVFIHFDGIPVWCTTEQHQQHQPLSDRQATVGHPKKKPGHLDRWP